MRVLWVAAALLGAILAAAGLFLPWGHVAVGEAQCATIYQEGAARQECQLRRIDVAYTPRGMDWTESSAHTVDGSRVGDVESAHEDRPYGPDNAALGWARSAIGLAAVATIGAGALRLSVRPRWPVLLGAASALAGTVLLALAVMAVHAAGLGGIDVEPLRPGRGSLALLLGAGLALLGAARDHARSDAPGPVLPPLTQEDRAQMLK